MSEVCAINDEHQFETRTGTIKIFRDGSYTRDVACPRCVEDIRKDEITEYRIFVINGEEVIIPTEEIDV